MSNPIPDFTDTGRELVPMLHERRRS